NAFSPLRILLQGLSALHTGRECGRSNSGEFPLLQESPKFLCRPCRRRPADSGGTQRVRPRISLRLPRTCEGGLPHAPQFFCPPLFRSCKASPVFRTGLSLPPNTRSCATPAYRKNL